MNYLNLNCLSYSYLNLTKKSSANCLMKSLNSLSYLKSLNSYKKSLNYSGYCKNCLNFCNYWMKKSYSCNLTMNLNFYSYLKSLRNYCDKSWMRNLTYRKSSYCLNSYCSKNCSGLNYLTKKNYENLNLNSLSLTRNSGKTKSYCSTNLMNYCFGTSYWMKKSSGTNLNLTS